MRKGRRRQRGPAATGHMTNEAARNGPSYGLTLFFLRMATIKTRWQRYKVIGRAAMTADDGKLMFHFNTPESTIWIDNVRFQESGGLF